MLGIDVGPTTPWAMGLGRLTATLWASVQKDQQHTKWDIEQIIRISLPSLLSIFFPKTTSLLYLDYYLQSLLEPSRSSSCCLLLLSVLSASSSPAPVHLSSTESLPGLYCWCVIELPRLANIHPPPSNPTVRFFKLLVRPRHSNSLELARPLCPCKIDEVHLSVRSFTLLPY